MSFNKVPKREILILAVGEICVSILICLGFLLAGRFDYTVATGALLGSAVTVLNFLFLSISVNRALDKIIDEGLDRDKLNSLYSEPDTESEKTDGDTAFSDTDGEETDETANDAADPAVKFANENAGKLQNAVKLSFIIRSASMIAALILAFITGWFDVIATIIPLFMLRPILTVSEMMRKEEK